MGQGTDLKESSQPYKQQMGLLASPQWSTSTEGQWPAQQDPSLNIPAKKVNIKLVSSEAETNCNFWVGLTQSGAASPAELLSIKSIPAIFDKAAQDGIMESGPVMLSDSKKASPRFIYLLPPPEEAQPFQQQWIEQLLKTLHSWAPPCAGFYFAPELLNPAFSFYILNEVLRRLIINSDSQQFYLLLGSHGLSAILNSTLLLRSELRTNNIDLAVFH